MYMKNEFYILINTIDKVKDFSSKVLNVTPDIDIIVGRYVIDAKSIMGLFSVDLSKPLLFKIHSDSENICNEVREKIKEFIVEV